jgi:small conductance mechanosensitive channel
VDEETVNELAAFDWSTLPALLQDKGVDLGVDLGIKVATAVGIFLVGKFAVRLVVSAIAKVMQKQQVDKTLETQTTSFIAIFGAAGLAVGLALQGSLSNFASGVLIVLFRPYRVGDWIEAAGISGSVEQVQILTTILKTGDNKQIIVPNSQIMDSIITNYSANDTRRVDMVVGVSYGDDLDQVRKTLKDILAVEDRILPEPAPTIAVSALADSSVNFVVRPWVKTSDYWGVMFDLTEAIKKRFDKEGISFPFPQQDVHLYNENSN